MLNFSGLLNRLFKLKVGLLVMLLRNTNSRLILHNGIGLMVPYLGKYITKGRIITSTKIRCKPIIPKKVLSSSNPKFPKVMKLRQYPPRICNAITINKSQG